MYWTVKSDCMLCEAKDKAFLKITQEDRDINSRFNEQMLVCCFEYSCEKCKEEFTFRHSVMFEGDEPNRNALLYLIKRVIMMYLSNTDNNREGSILKELGGNYLYFKKAIVCLIVAYEGLKDDE